MAMVLLTKYYTIMLRKSLQYFHNHPKNLLDNTKTGPCGPVREFLYFMITCTKSMYTAVPTAMDSIMLRRQRCRMAVTAMAMSSGAPCRGLAQDTSFRQYMTSRPNMAAGNVLPR